MRADLLLEQFDTLVRTPEDVASLEAAILDLAVRGQLVPQDPDDEPATELLKKIKSDRKRFPPIESDEMPYELPGNWAWARLGEVFELEYGKSLPKKKRDSDGDVSVYGSNGVIGHHSKALVDTPCVVVGRKGSSGAVNLARRPCWVIDTAFFVRPPDGVDLAFSFHLLRSLRLETLGKGIKPGLNRNEAYNLTVALPPLGEQKRIVARVDELLAQTRALAAQLAAADEALVPAAQASFQALSDAPDKAQQSEAWQRINDAFDALTADPRTLDALKQTVLQLAVQGKLVPQDPEDEPASVLLKRIRLEKLQLLREKKLRKPKPLPRIDDSEIRYELPSEWEWTRVGNIADHRLGKMLDKHKNKGAYYPYLRNLNVQWLRIDLDDVLEMRFESHEIGEYELKLGDLLICEGGEPGRCAIWEHPDIQMMFQKAIHRVRPFGGILPQYMLYHLWADAGGGVLSRYFTGATIKHFTGKALASYVFALPPVAEQKRIVAKVESLLALCDKLAAEVIAAEEVRGRLLAAVLNGE